MKTKTLLEEVADELDRGAALRSAQPRSAPLELGDIAAAIRRAVAGDLLVQRLRMQNECTLQMHAPIRSTK